MIGSIPFPSPLLCSLRLWGRHSQIHCGSSCLLSLFLKSRSCSTESDSDQKEQVTPNKPAPPTSSHTQDTAGVYSLLGRVGSSLQPRLFAHRHPTPFPETSHLLSDQPMPAECEVSQLCLR